MEGVCETVLGDIPALGQPGHQRNAVHADVHQLLVDTHEVPDIDVAIVCYRIEIVRVFGAAKAKRAARRRVGEIGFDGGDRRAADRDGYRVH
jgi:hypothetical protein